jgi:3-hydroxyisobutyrate dehydrogenase-like beta-hydroxyacid dehydrogenase
MTVSRVAVLGTGRMGAAMARRLQGAGFELTLYNRTRSRAEEVAGPIGATVAGSPGEAADGADAVISSLADATAVTGVLEGPDGAIAGLAPDAVLLETSTVEPAVVRSLAPAVQERGAHLLDAPVSGSVPAVDAGELMVMVGGEAGALERARPVLEPLSARIIHVGALGTGATVKLAVNGVVHALNVALSEALVLAERAGIAREVMYEVLASSAAAAPFVHYKRAAFERPEETPVAFRLALVEKDLDLLTTLAEDLGAPMGQALATRRIAAAAAAELGDHDMAAVASYLRGAGEPGTA